MTGFDIDNERWVAFKFQDIGQAVKNKGLPKNKEADVLKQYEERILAEAKQVAKVYKSSTRDTLSSLFENPIARQPEEKVIVTIMPLEEGRELLDIATSSPNMSSGRWIEIAINICESIQKLHKLNVLHRDIKLENILLNPVTAQVSLIDFGMATDSQSSAGVRYLSEEICGTPGYLAPEILRTCIYNEKTEVYALGRSLQELFSLHDDRNDSGELESRFLDKLMSPELHKEMDDLVCRMMEPNPKDRISLDKAIEELKKMRDLAPDLSSNIKKNSIAGFE